MGPAHVLKASSQVPLARGPPLTCEGRGEKERLLTGLSRTSLGDSMCPSENPTPLLQRSGQAVPGPPDTHPNMHTPVPGTLPHLRERHGAACREPRSVLPALPQDPGGFWVSARNRTAPGSQHLLSPRVQATGFTNVTAAAPHPCGDPLALSSPS